MNPSNKKLLGLRVVRVLYILSIVFLSVSLVGLILLPSKIDTSNTFAYLISLFNLIFAVMMIIAINRPKQIFFRVVLGFIFTDILISSVSVFVDQLAVYYVLSIIIDLLMLWYLIKIKSYFITGSIDIENPNIKRIDKRFVGGLVGIIILGFVGLMVFGGINGYREVKKDAEQRAQFITAFNGKTVDQGVDYCKSLSDQKDDCLVDLISLSEHVASGKMFKVSSTQLDVSICNSFDGENGKFFCYAVFNRCDLLTNGKLKDICPTAVESWQSSLNKKP